MPSRGASKETRTRPKLVAIPGGRSTVPTPAVQPTPRTHSSRGLRVVFATIAAVLIAAIAIGGLLSLNGLLHQQPATGTNGITPPAGPGGTQALSAGMRFVFLRDGALWSTQADGSRTHPERLTPQNVTVAANWTVSPPLPGRSAGDMIAYIDQQKALVHTLRSDSQEDTAIKQPLLGPGVNPATIWDTQTGSTILNGLAWSSDGTTLAFVAAPNNSGQTGLYIYSTATGQVQHVALPITGSVSHLVWSPDGVRLAFEVTNNGAVSILDYNAQNHGVLTIATGIGTQTSAGDSVLTLDWSPRLDTPTITWSIGVIGHVHSLWERRVGVDSSVGARQLLSGDFVQAVYSRNGHDGVGSWLVVTSQAGRDGDLWRIDLTPGSTLVQMTSGKQVSFVQWSPDGQHIDYLDNLSGGLGTLHVLNAQTDFDALIASNVVIEPAPAWSSNGQEIAFSTGTQIGIVNLQISSSASFLKLKGAASAMIWSPTSSHQLVVALSDDQLGIYLVDTAQNTAQKVDQSGTDGPIFWTEIP